MRVADLLKVLKSCAQDAEIRVAANVDAPESFGATHDLPIIGVSKDNAAEEVLTYSCPGGPAVLWIVTSYALKSWPKPHVSKRMQRKS